MFMITSFMSLIKSISELRWMKPEADSVLKNTVSSNILASKQYAAWKKGYRLNTTIYSAHFALQFCKLEGFDFNFTRRKMAYLGSATACISDDLIDNSDDWDLDKVAFLDCEGHKIGDKSLSLFYSFHEGLQQLLPDYFIVKHSNLIDRYNTLQEKSKLLMGDLSNKELTEIKNGTGGYPFLLLHRIMFPDREDIADDFAPCYNPQGSLPSNEDHAIFNYGALISRIDDLDDLRQDISEKRLSLATRNLITWSSINQDLLYVRKGLEKFYSTDRVDEVMNVYSSTGMRLLSLLGSCVAKQ